MVNGKLYKSVLIWGVIFICVVLMSLLIVFIDKFSVPRQTSPMVLLLLSVHLWVW